MPCGVPLGTFYKRRDYTRIVDGKNPIIAHEFLGDSVEGMDILIVDDMISSGDSMIDIAQKMKEKGARNVYCAVTFGLFTEGIDHFNEAYEKGIINKVFATNLIYRRPELLQAPWFADVNLCKFVALLIDAINHDASLSSLINPTEKIKKLLIAVNLDIYFSITVIDITDMLLDIEFTSDLNAYRLRKA